MLHEPEVFSVQGERESRHLGEVLLKDYLLLTDALFHEEFVLEV